MIIESIINHDRLKYSSYVRIGGVEVQHRIFDYMKEIPEGAYVKLTIEILDDRAKKRGIVETPWQRAKEKKSYQKQESRLASRRGGSAQLNSGRHWFSKRDNKFYSFLIEARTTIHKTYAVDSSELKKLTMDAHFHKSLPALNIEFEKIHEDWTLIRTIDFEDMYERILQLEARLENYEE